MASLNGRCQGISLIELILASAILSGMMIAGAFILQNLGRAQRERDLRQIAQQLGLDQVEILKSHAYANIPVTAEEDAPIDGCLRGPEAYDRNPDQWPPEDLRWGSVHFKRQTCVETMQLDALSGQLTAAPSGSWTGLKRFVIRVRWPAAKPTHEAEIESVMKDPAGPLILAQSTGTVVTSAACTDTVAPPQPCAAITFYLIGHDGALRDFAASDRQGKVIFSRAPVGISTIQPQLESGQKSSPVDFLVSLPEMGATVTVPAFIISRAMTAVTFTSNRDNTLVIAAPAPPENRPPDLLFRSAKDPGIYSEIISDPTTVSLPYGRYFFRCWWTDSRGQTRKMDPPGGMNALLSSADAPTYACRFDE